MPQQNDSVETDKIFEPEDDLLFLDDEIVPVSDNKKYWKILVVDDERQVHEVTRLALKNFSFENKHLEILSAYSGHEAQSLLEQHPDIAVLLLDVVMETSQAGLDLVRYIRENIHNVSVRIILRTGQPGDVPEISIIKGYDINAYKTKTELTQQKLFSTLLTAIRSYRDIISAEDDRREIATLNEKLQGFNRKLEESVRNRTQELEAKNQLLEAEIQAHLKTQDRLKSINTALDFANHELDQLNRQLALAANQDGLTKLANRRRFDEYLEQVWKQTLRDQSDLTLILCDIDYFKQYNDTYGHLQGDHCLQMVAQVIDRAVERPLDLAARYGGEEFAIILPNTNATGAISVAEKLRKSLEQRALLHESSLVSDCITLSIGISTLIPTTQLTSSALIATTDTALYKAKKAGRAQVACHQTQSLT